MSASDTNQTTQPAKDAGRARYTTALPFNEWLEQEGGYLFVRSIPWNRWAGIYEFMFTVAIIVGNNGDTTGYSDRWCYKSLPEAILALDVWDGTGEPTGWHRHPMTGRRVNDDGELEQYF